MVYKRLWYSHKFSQVFIIRQAITCSYYSQLLSLLNRRTWYLFRAYWSLWCLRVLLLLLCRCTVLVFFLIWSPNYLKVYYDFGDCSFILMNVWKVGCICSTVTQPKFTVTKCINHKNLNNILILISEPIGHMLQITFIIVILRGIL
jgi:hypothetical protein